MATATTSRSQRVLLWVTPLLVSILLLWFATAVASDPRARGPVWILGVIIAIVTWWSYLSVPRTIVIDDAHLVFERPIGKLPVAIGEIHRIDARAWNRGFVVISAQNRKICLLQGTKNLAAIVTEIRQQKPSVTIVGNVNDSA